MQRAQTTAFEDLRFFMTAFWLFINSDKNYAKI